MEAYNHPFIQESRGQAVRAFTEAVNDPKSELFKWPGDYTLFEIATFDQLTGQIEMYKTHHKIGLALEFKAVDPQLSLPIKREEAPIEARIN